jgi:hypothetical protein
MRAALVGSVVVVAGLAGHVRADDTFESKAAGAQRLKHIDDLVWALTATCDRGDDTQNRQCKKLRDGRVAELANATLIVEADHEAFKVSAWNPQTRSVPLALDSCIRCNGIEVDGKTWFVVGTKDGSPAPTWKGAKLVTGSLHANARPFGDEASAKVWAKTASQSAVQLLVHVGPKARQTIDGKNVLALDVLGYRVFSRCDGGIVCASPKSQAVELETRDKTACGTIASGATAAAGDVLDALTPKLISQTLRPIDADARACGVRHGVHGAGKVRLTVAADGSVVSAESSGVFANTKAGECIEALVKQVTFAKTKKEKTVFSYPIKLP